MLSGLRLVGKAERPGLGEDPMSEGAILLSTVCVKEALAWRIDGQEWPAYEGCRMQSEQLS